MFVGLESFLPLFDVLELLGVGAGETIVLKNNNFAFSIESKIRGTIQSPEIFSLTHLSEQKWERFPHIPVH